VKEKFEDTKGLIRRE